MRLFFLLLMLTALPGLSYAQSQFKVADGETVEILEHTVLKVKDLSNGKILEQKESDANGAIHSAYSPKPGVYQFCFSLLGYESYCSESPGYSILLKKSSIDMNDAIVKATRMASNPTNVTVTQQDLSKQNLGQDLPILLNATPSAVTFSDAGNGIGYTGIRIRGVDASRINVTVNGVPLNDAESQGVYWVNMPDFATSTDNIQVQRGIGTSSNGTAAFGSSINIQTANNNKRAYGEVNISGGYVLPDQFSNGTLVENRYSQKYNVRFGTGLIGRWAIDGRLSKIHSDGYVDNSASNLKSYYISATRFGENSQLKLVHFSGKEVTGQAWNGIPEARLKGDQPGMLDYIINNELNSKDSAHLMNSANRTYNAYTYPNQTDNYQQDHYQALYSLQMNRNWLINTALHYTRGKGYYEEYKSGTSVTNYNLGLDTALHITTTDLIRRRWLDNHFGGATFSALYKKGQTEWTSGGSFNIYKGKHLGEVIWARDAGSSEINHPYYTGKSWKSDMNVYSKLNRRLNKKLALFADVQFRYIHYETSGVDDNSGAMLPYNFNLNYMFFNPKAGLNMEISKKEQAYIYIGKSGREPVRSDIIAASTTSIPKPENMYDLEMGYSYKKTNYSIAANGYLMYYKNQLVSDGSVNDVGTYNRINVPESYRAGIELMGSVNITKKIQWTGNITFSRNKIVTFNEYITFYTDSGSENKLLAVHKNADLATSPSVVSSSMFRFLPIRGMSIDLVSKYVSKQYLDNTQSDKRKLNAFFVNDIRVSYEIKTREFKYIRLGLLLNNVLNVAYEPNGYTYGWLYNGQRYDYNFYYPQARFNTLLQITVGW